MRHGAVDRTRPGLVAPQRAGDLRKLYAAEIVSGAGDGIFWVALVVHLSEQPRFGLWLTLAVVARLAPRALLSLPAGSLVDRVSVRPLLIWIECIRAVTMAVLTVVVAMDGPPILVLAGVLVSYTASSPTRPALSAIVPAIAGESRLANVNAVLSTIRQIMTFVGPLIGTLVVAWSTAAGFAVNAATFAIAGLIIATVSIPRHPVDRSTADQRPGRLGMVGSFVDGLSAAATIPAMPAIVGLITVMYVARGAEMVLHVFVVRDLLAVDVGAIGLLGGAIGLGALLAMPLAAREASADRPVRAILLSIAVTAVPTAALALVGRTLVACVLLVAVGVGMVVFEVVTVVMLQRVTPTPALGRVFGAVNSASNAGKLLGAVSAPLLIAAVGLRWSLLLIAIALAIGAAFAIRPLIVLGRVATARRRVLEPRVSELAKLAIFDGATRSALERIAAVIVEAPVAAGAVVMHEGDAPDDLCICVTGRLAVSRQGRRLDVVGAGDHVGEIGLIEHRPRTATVTAIDDSMLWRIPGETFLSVLEDAGAPPSALVDGMADRVAAHR